MVATPKPSAPQISGAFHSRLDAPKRGVEPTSPVSGRETTAREASTVPPDVGASRVGDVSDLLLAEVETRRILALDEHRAVEITMDTLAVAGISLRGEHLLSLRDRQARFGSLAAQLQHLGYRIQQQQNGCEDEEEITRSSEAWKCQARKTEWRELDARTARAMTERSYFGGAPW